MSSKENEEKLFFLMVFFAMILWGGSWVSGRLLSAQGNPLIIMFWRFLFTFIAFLPFLWFKRKEIVKIDRWSFLYTMGAAVVICAYNLCFLSGLKASLAGKGGVLVTTINPIFAFLISLIIFRQQIQKQQLFGLILGLIGGTILVEPWTWSSRTLADLSNLIFLGAALSWAILTFFSHAAQKKLHPFVFNPLLYLMATVLSIFFLPGGWLEESMNAQLSFWLNILYLAVAAGAVGAGIYFWAASRLGAARASTVTFCIPALALLLSWLLLNEKPEWQTILGGAVSILAVLIINNRIRIQRFQTSC